MSNDVYALASVRDPRYDDHLEQPDTKQCDGCLDHSANVLTIDSCERWCLGCIRRGRLTKRVIREFPDDRVREVLKAINSFIVANL